MERLPCFSGIQVPRYEEEEEEEEMGGAGSHERDVASLKKKQAGLGLGRR